MFSEGHNNGIIEGIPIDHTRRAIIDILPYFKARYDSSRRKNIGDIPPGTVYRYAIDDTIILCVKTVLCIKLLGFRMSQTPKNGDGNAILGLGFPTDAFHIIIFPIVYCLCRMADEVIRARQKVAVLRHKNGNQIKAC